MSGTRKSTRSCVPLTLNDVDACLRLSDGTGMSVVSSSGATCVRADPDLSPMSTLGSAATSMSCVRSASLAHWTPSVLPRQSIALKPTSTTPARKTPRLSRSFRTLPGTAAPSEGAWDIVSESPWYATRVATDEFHAPLRRRRSPEVVVRNKRIIDSLVIIARLVRSSVPAQRREHRSRLLGPSARQGPDVRGNSRRRRD
jgi:hypothetical protein